MAVISKRLPKLNQEESLRYFLIASFILHLLLLLILPKRDLTSITDPPSPWEEGAISISFQPLDQPLVDPSISVSAGEQTLVEVDEPSIEPAQEVVVPVSGPGSVAVPEETLQQAVPPVDRSDPIQPQNLPAPMLQQATVGEVNPDRIPVPQSLPQQPAIPAAVNEVNPDTLPTPQVLPPTQPAIEVEAPQASPPLQPAIEIEAPQVMPPLQPAIEVEAPQVMPPLQPAIEAEAPQVMPPLQPAVEMETPQVLPPTQPAIETEVPQAQAPVRPEFEPESPPVPQVTPQELVTPDRNGVAAIEDVVPPTQAPDRPFIQGPENQAPDRTQLAQAPDSPLLPTGQAPVRPNSVEGPEPSDWQPPDASAPVRSEINPDTVTPPDRPQVTPTSDRPEPHEAPDLPESSSPLDLPITRPTVQPPPTYGASLHFPSIGLDPPKDMVTQQPVTVSVLITFDENGAFVGTPELLPGAETVDPSILRDAPLYVLYSVSITQPAPAGYVCQAIVHVTFDPTAPAGSGVRFSYDDEQQRVGCYPV